ncbi:hypothetical protein [Xylella fastidiosa]|uniref:hypothetical protein n=1 Tax=Xylella fastidiosa TaxID=2371 RepID=UPI001E56942B|nr:hypothetical protein [Xylella fastidiosa]
MADACTVRIFSLSPEQAPCCAGRWQITVAQAVWIVELLVVLIDEDEQSQQCVRLVCACGAAVYVECGVSIQPQESVCLTLKKNDVTSRKIFIDGCCEAYQEDKSAIEIIGLNRCVGMLE